MKKLISLLFLSILWTSCSVEKVNLSPLSNSFTSYSLSSNLVENSSKSFDKVNYLSEITNTLSEFPTFSVQNLNAEIYKMKLYISDYIYAIKQNDNANKTKAYKNFTTTYKNIQNLKSNLTPEEIELLNRYLVKIKTNISLIDSIDITETK